MNPRKIPPIVERALEECGLPWSIEHRTKHRAVMVDGRQVAVLSKGTSGGGPDAFRNVVSAIRRAARKVNGETSRDTQGRRIEEAC